MFVKMLRVIKGASMCLLAPLTTAQTAAVHSTNFNSSFALTPSQVSSAQLDTFAATSLQNIISFDRSQLAFGGPSQDEFYTLPPRSATDLQPGLLLKLQESTDPTAYTIPPSTALSRLLYTTTNYNGTVLPASGFLLWPFQPRSIKSNRVPVIVWTHGTSGFFADQAPSSHRGLWYDNSAVFALAEAGYAVFAPDYAGLGISQSWDGAPIPHQYQASPAGAKDALYGLRAARQAFPRLLSDEFVILGHSQGGGVAWAAAEALASDADFADLTKGYRGTIAASPRADTWNSPETFITPTVGVMLGSIFPAFKIEEWLTELGVQRLELAKEVQGGIAAVQQLFFGIDGLVKKGWDATWYKGAFARLMDPGAKQFKGPMLVLQGDSDVYVPLNVTEKVVAETLKKSPDGDLELYVARGVGHTPILHATKLYWLKWIDDRIDGRALARKGGVRTDVNSWLPAEWYQKSKYAFPLWTWLPEYQYESTTAL